jgi:hypothetical protein
MKNKAVRKGRRRGLIAIGGAVAAAETAGLWVRTRRLGGNVVVRCRQGHLYSTIWLPAASVKALRLGPWRFQYCPVGHHWSLVTPVDETTLTADELRRAREQRDARLP